MYDFNYSISDKNLKITIPTQPSCPSWSYHLPRKDFQKIVNLLSEELKKDKKLELTKKLEELDKQRQQIVDELRDVS